MKKLTREQIMNYKEYKLEVYHTRRGKKEVTGTLDDLIKYFSYTLEIGSSYNSRVNKNPKTIKSLVSNLQKAYDEKESTCYERTYVNLLK